MRSRRRALRSNSAGLRQFDPDGLEADALEASLGVAVLRHGASSSLEGHSARPSSHRRPAGAKKPGGSCAALEAHFGCAAELLIMVGDRYLTDVLYGNRHGMLTARPAPFLPARDGAVVRASRALEDALVRRWRSRGAVAPPHRLLSSGFVSEPQNGK